MVLTQRLQELPWFWKILWFIFRACGCLSLLTHPKRNVNTLVNSIWNKTTKLQQETCFGLPWQGKMYWAFYWIWLRWSLFFFITASTVLYFRFVTKTVLVTHQCFRWGVLTQCQDLHGLLLLPAPQQMAWEGTQTGKLTKTDQELAPCHVTACFAIKLEGKLPFPKVDIAQGLAEH